LKANPTHSTRDQAWAGQAAYNKGTLSAYDFFVLGFSNRFLWKCPTRELLTHYNSHLSANHLDVGVGTGYFLDRCRFPSSAPRVALMDMNPVSLSFAARRIARYQPETYTQNILRPIEQPIAHFDSVGINYLLHCLPGSLDPGDKTCKAVVFSHLASLMKPGASLFGSTLLQGHRGMNRPAQALMTFYNRKGIFSNAPDSLDNLKSSLEQAFCDVTITQVGCVALFSARIKK
jgi:2-polyprenyl-3-methyl-5-hydroxy-6-metoxy-1,4-benzoquinol methylase